MDSDLARASLKRSPVDFLAARAVKGSSEAVRRFSHRIVLLGSEWDGWGCGDLVGWTGAPELGNVALSARPEMRRRA